MQNRDHIATLEGPSDPFEKFRKDEHGGGKDRNFVVAPDLMSDLHDMLDKETRQALSAAS